MHCSKLVSLAQDAVLQVFVEITSLKIIVWGILCCVQSELMQQLQIIISGAGFNGALRCSINAGVWRNNKLYAQCRYIAAPLTLLGFNFRDVSLQNKIKISFIVSDWFTLLRPGSLPVLAAPFLPLSCRFLLKISFWIFLITFLSPQ